MSGPSRLSAVCSSSPSGGMRNTCGRTAILFSHSEKPGFWALLAYPEPGEE
jgi:hypothetical protein